MRQRRRTGAMRSIIYSLLALATPTLAAFQNDFSAYPAGAQACLTSASDSSNCNGDNVKTMNSCLCSNGGNFVLASAQCIGKKSPSDLGSTYAELAVNCLGSNTPLTVSQAQFLAAASGTVTATAVAKTTTKTTKTTTTSASTTASTTTSTTNTASTTSTSTGAIPTQTGNGNGNNKNEGGLSTGVKIAIAVVATAIGVGAIVALVFCLRHRRRRSREEAQPMLSQYPPTSGLAAAGALPGGDHSPRPSELSTYYDPASIKPGGENKSGWGAASETDTVPSGSPYSAHPSHVSHQAWDATNAQAQLHSWGPTPPPQQQQQQLHPAWAAGAQVPPQQQQWHQPPALYAEQQQQQQPQQQIYELASIPVARYSNAVEMPASPAVPQPAVPQPAVPQHPGAPQYAGPAGGQSYPGQQTEQQYPGQWRR